MKQHPRSLVHLRFSQAGLVERIFVVLVLLLASGAFLNLGIAKEAHADPQAGSPFMRSIWIATYIGTLFLVWRFCKNTIRIATRQRWLLALLFLALASTFWSLFPALTLRRTTAVALTTLFGIYFAERFSIRNQIRLLGWALCIAAVLSLVFHFFGIGRAIDDLPGAWFGVY